MMQDIRLSETLICKSRVLSSNLSHSNKYLHKTTLLCKQVSVVIILQLWDVVKWFVYDYYRLLDYTTHKEKFHLAILSSQIFWQ